MEHLTAAPDRIAIFRALQLGDMLCTVPAFRALRAAFPQAKITLIGLPWAERFARRFWRYLDDFIVFPGWPGLPEQEPRLDQIPAFLKDLQARKFDLAIQMQGSGSISNPLVVSFGARSTAGFYRPGEYGEGQPGFFPYPQGEHEIRIFLHLMRELGVAAAGESLEFPVSEAEKQSFARFREALGFESNEYAVLHPGARFAGRRLPPEIFAGVGDALAEMGLKVIVTGTQSERELTRAVVEHMRYPAVDAGGQTDLGTLALLISNARILISNDTGVSHIAAAFETPSVILFTVSDADRWRPLNHRIHRGILNALEVSVEEILGEVMPLVRETSSYATQP